LMTEEKRFELQCTEIYLITFLQLSFIYRKEN
jgi:hypothetical protein